MRDSTADRQETPKTKVRQKEKSQHPPISPLNRLNVLGMRTWGLTSMSVFFAVWMYTCSSPALFNGESSSVNKHYTAPTDSASPHVYGIRHSK